MHEPVRRVQFGVFEKFTSAYLFQIAQEKSCDYLLIIYIKNFEMVKQKKRTCIKQSRKNCAIQGVCLISKQKTWLTICKFLWSLTNQNAWFVSSFCTELTLFCTVFEKNYTALNQSKWRNFFMYIIKVENVLLLFHCWVIRKQSFLSLASFPGSFISPPQKELSYLATFGVGRWKILETSLSHT